MLKQEFDQLTGREVSDEYYEVVEAAYMAHRADGDRDTLRVLSVQLLGRKAYIKECPGKGYSLTDEDRQYLLDLMDHE